MDKDVRWYLLDSHNTLIGHPDQICSLRILMNIKSDMRVIMHTPRNHSAAQVLIWGINFMTHMQQKNILLSLVFIVM